MMKRIISLALVFVFVLAVASDAFQHPTSWEKTKNSLSFLEHLAQKYPEQYISCMTSKEPLGLGAKWGYLFDHYKELYEILERAVPDVKEKYGLDNIIDMDKVFDIIGRKRGCLMKGNVVDLDKVYTIIINDLKEGKVGKVTFDR